MSSIKIEIFFKLKKERKKERKKRKRADPCKERKKNLPFEMPWLYRTFVLNVVEVSSRQYLRA